MEMAAKWYVARTRHGREIGVRDRLGSLGVECFIPTRRRKSADGRRTVEQPLVNSLIFLKATRQEALDLIHYRGVQADYLFDCATHQLMTVPQKQMEDFRRVLELQGKIYVVVGLLGCIFARARVPRAWLERI